MDIPWYALIPIIAVVGGLVIALAGTLRGGRKETEEKLLAALADNAAANRALADRLDQLDKRLATVEKTLTDIPG